MAVPECTSCGTCCFSRAEAYVRVRGDDHARLGARAGELVVFHGNQAFMRMRDGHCAALRIGDGPDRFFCTVYEARPQICRDLLRGSPECQGELATKGERPLRVLPGG